MGLFDFFKPKTIIVDNKAWVKANSKHINKEDVEGTFDFVQSHHPLQGCAQSEMPKLSDRKSLVGAPGHPARSLKLEAVISMPRRSQIGL